MAKVTGISQKFAPKDGNRKKHINKFGKIAKHSTGKNVVKAAIPEKKLKTIPEASYNKVEKKESLVGNGLVKSLDKKGKKFKKQRNIVESEIIPEFVPLNTASPKKNKKKNKKPQKVVESSDTEATAHVPLVLARHKLEKKLKHKKKVSKEGNKKPLEEPLDSESDNSMSDSDDEPTPKKKKREAMLKKAEAREYDPLKEAATIFIGNLPTNTKRVQLAKYLAKFAPIESIRFRTADGKVIFKHKARKESKSLCAYVVLKNDEMATKALELNGSEFKGIHLRVTKADRNAGKQDSFINKEAQKRTVFVGNVKTATTDEQLREFFSSCGEIEYVRTFPNNVGFAFVCFKKPESVGLALELKDTLLDGQAIRVNRYKKDQDAESKAQRTVVLQNLLSSTTEDHIREKFSKIGDIEYAKLNRNDNKITGFVCFKETKIAKKVLNCTDITVNGSPVKVTPFIGKEKRNPGKPNKKNIYRGKTAQGAQKKKSKKQNSKMENLAKKIAPKVQ